MVPSGADQPPNAGGVEGGPVGGADRGPESGGEPGVLDEIGTDGPEGGVHAGAEGTPGAVGSLVGRGSIGMGSSMRYGPPDTEQDGLRTESTLRGR